MAIDDLGPAERFVAGAIGEPGSRTFYLQVTAGGTTHALLAEKEQIAALASQGLEILDAGSIGADDDAVQRIIDAGGKKKSGIPPSAPLCPFGAGSRRMLPVAAAVSAIV